MIILGVVAVVAVLQPRPIAPPLFPLPTFTPTPAPTDTLLGKRYEKGDGVLQDYGKAREWYEKAAAKGDADAKKKLGR